MGAFDEFGHVLNAESIDICVSIEPWRFWIVFDVGIPDIRSTSALFQNTTEFETAVII